MHLPVFWVWLSQRILTACSPHCIGLTHFTTRGGWWLLLVMGWPVLAPPVAAQSAVSTSTLEPRILVVGDSLSAEYGLQRGTGWVALLEKQLKAEHVVHQIINASVSGDTTSGGRSRLPSLLLRHRPSHVVIELGGNDALRGLPLSMTESNLAAMVQAATQTKARVTLVGMQVPPNYGPTYARDFSGLYTKVAQAHKAALVPFLLKGVADGPQAADLFQADRIHPNESAQAAMLANVWPVLRPQLGKP